MDNREKWLLGGGILLLGYTYYHMSRRGRLVLPSPPTSTNALRQKIKDVLGPYVPPRRSFNNLNPHSDGEPIDEDIDAIDANLQERFRLLMDSPENTTDPQYRGWTLCNTYVNLAVPWHLPDDSLAYGFVRVWARIVKGPAQQELVGGNSAMGDGYVWQLYYEPVFIPNPHMPNFWDIWAMVPAGMKTEYTRPDPNQAYLWTPKGQGLPTGSPFAGTGCDKEEFARVIEPSSIAPIILINADGRQMLYEYLTENEVKSVWCDIPNFTPPGDPNQVTFTNCSNLLAVKE